MKTFLILLLVISSSVACSQHIIRFKIESQDSIHLKAWSDLDTIIIDSQSAAEVIFACKKSFKIEARSKGKFTYSMDADLEAVLRNEGEEYILLESKFN